MGKRKRSTATGKDPLQEVYRNVEMTPRESTGRPGTPHRFFQLSYAVSVHHETSIQEQSATEALSKLVVHRHANGLCIVTVSEEAIRSKKINRVDYLVQEAPECSNAAKRKRQVKALKSGAPAAAACEQGMVTPSTIIAEITMEKGTILSIPAGVWGSVLELNRNMSPELLLKDTQLDGYLAVILPTGPFPPPCPIAQDDEPRKRLDSSIKGEGMVQKDEE
jgi:hypothetical protein